MEIFPEKYPSPPGALSQTAIDQQCHDLVAQFANTPDFLQRIENMSTANRDGDYRVRYANLLNEMQELVLSKADEGSTKIYLSWRLKHLDENDGFIRTESPLDEQPDYGPEADQRRQAKQEQWDKLYQNELTEIDGQISGAPSFLKPYLQIQRAALQFRRGDFDGASKGFGEVISEAPETGRAEVAQLMLARCAIEKARALRGGKEWQAIDQKIGQDIQDEWKKAGDLLQTYKQRYHNGRFLSDVYGWQGALASDQGDYEAAIQFYLHQMDVKPTREVIRSALRECNRCFGEYIDKQPSYPTTFNEKTFQALARHPAVAMCLIYQCIDDNARVNPQGYPFAEDYSGGRDWLEHLDQRLMQAKPGISDFLMGLGAAIGRNKEAFDAKEWKAFYLAGLGWIALENGDLAQALALTGLGQAVPDPGGDLLMVRGLALERLGRYLEAIKTYSDLRLLSPHGPLSVDLNYRIARCQRHIAQQGFAAVELAYGWSDASFPSYQRDVEAAQSPFPPLREDGEIAQWIDILLHFAPMEQLEEVAKTPGLNPDFALKVRDMIRGRAMAREDFDCAEKWLEETPKPPKQPDASVDSTIFRLDDWHWMGHKEWNDLVAPILAAKADFRKAKDPDARAKALFKIGSLWDTARGKITSPSLDPRGLMNDQPELTDVRRSKNARLLGLTDNQIAEELDRRDEDWHALQAYLAAADLAQNPQIKAAALSEANSCLLRMAQLTPYQAERAFELKREALSRDIYQRLKTQCRGTSEADKAAFYNFPALAELGEWLPDDRAGFNVDDDLATLFGTQYGGNEVPLDHELNNSRKADSPQSRLEALSTKAASMSLEEIGSELSAIRKSFLPNFESADQSYLINNLDDFDLFLKIPGVTPVMCGAYFPIRLSGKLPTDIPPILAPAKDFLAYLEAADAKNKLLPVANDPQAALDALKQYPESARAVAIQEYPGDYNTDYSQYPYVQPWIDFLQKYPNSSKAEAARLRIAREIYHTYRTHVGVRPYFWPESPNWYGYKTIAVSRYKPFNAGAIFAALNDYDTRYPKGRYVAEIRLMRGGASIDSGDYKTAINSLVSILDDQTKKDLHYDASLQLAQCFSLLSNDEKRNSILEALKLSPRGIYYLHRFIESNTFGSLLRTLDSYIRETIGKSTWDSSIAEKSLS